MQGKLVFATAQLEIGGQVLVHLENFPSGHISLPAHPLCPELNPPHDFTDSAHLINYPTLTEPPLQPVTDSQLFKIHKHLSHSSEYALANLLRAGRRLADTAQIQRVLRGCSCHGVAGRIAPPKVTAWMARFNGEIIGVDVIQPLWIPNAEDLVTMKESLEKARHH